MTEENRKILLVDDVESFTSVLARAFEKRGFQVSTACNEDEALHEAKKVKPDLAVLDLKLEESSGLSLIPQIKEISPDTAILILTGYSSISTAVEAIKLGAVNYLCKPANADEILLAFEKNEGDADIELADTPPSLNRMEWEHLQKVLKEHDGNISATARALGMHRRTLQRKLQKRPVKN